jgi:hypothetical protein
MFASSFLTPKQPPSLLPRKLLVLQLTSKYMPRIFGIELSNDEVKMAHEMSIDDYIEEDEEEVVAAIVIRTKES